MLIGLDADALDAAVGAWLRAHADCDEVGWRSRWTARTLRGCWNDDGRLVLFSALTHRGMGPRARSSPVP
jgi:hypothetical protein